MEFLDINLTKVFYSMLLTVPSILVDFKKTIPFSGFKNPYKKIRETRKLESIHEKHFLEQGRKPEPDYVMFREPRNRFQEIDSASLCSLTGRYDNPFCRTGPSEGWRN